MSIWLTSRLDLLVAGLMAVGLHGAAIAHMIRADTVIVAAAPAMAGEVTVAPDGYTQMIEAWETPTLVAQSAPIQRLPQNDDALGVDLPDDTPSPKARIEGSPPVVPDPIVAPAPPMLDETAPAPQIALPMQTPPPAIAPKPRPERRASAPKPEPAKPKPVVQPTAKATPAPIKAPSAPAAKATVKPAAPSGQGGTGTVAVSKAQTASLMSKWGATIRRNIQRAQRYPRAANGATGQVKLKLSVAANGGLAAVSIAQSSGHPVLDQAAVAAAKSARRFASAPKGLTNSSYIFSISLNFLPN
ncbi:MAG: TonB family protein [Litorimonas sp.]